MKEYQCLSGGDGILGLKSGLAYTYTAFLVGFPGRVSRRWPAGDRGPRSKRKFSGLMKFCTVFPRSLTPQLNDLKNSYIPSFQTLQSCGFKYGFFCTEGCPANTFLLLWCYHDMFQTWPLIFVQTIPFAFPLALVAFPRLFISQRLVQSQKFLRQVRWKIKMSRQIWTHINPSSILHLPPLVLLLRVMRFCRLKTSLNFWRMTYNVVLVYFTGFV